MPSPLSSSALLDDTWSEPAPEVGGDGIACGACDAAGNKEGRSSGSLSNAPDTPARPSPSTPIPMLPTPLSVAQACLSHKTTHHLMKACGAQQPQFLYLGLPLRSTHFAPLFSPQKNRKSLDNDPGGLPRFCFESTTCFFLERACGRWRCSLMKHHSTWHQTTERGRQQDDTEAQGSNTCYRATRSGYQAGWSKKRARRQHRRQTSRWSWPSTPETDVKCVHSVSETLMCMPRVSPTRLHIVSANCVSPRPPSCLGAIICNTIMSLLHRVRLSCSCYHKPRHFSSTGARRVICQGAVGRTIALCGGKGHGGKEEPPWAP